MAWYDELLEALNKPIDIQPNSYLTTLSVDSNYEEKIYVSFLLSPDNSECLFIPFHLGNRKVENVFETQQGLGFIFEFRDEFSLKGNLTRLLCFATQQLHQWLQNEKVHDLMNDPLSVCLTHQDDILMVMERVNLVLASISNMKFRMVDVPNEHGVYFRLEGWHG